MAEVTGLRNNALPYPIYAQPFGATFPILDADGDLVTAAASLDSEVSKNGDTYADCTNEATEIATSSGTLTVKVYQSGTGQVIADAARVEYMGPIDPNPPPPPTGVTFAQLEAEAANARDALKAVADEQYEYAVQRAHELTGQ